MQEVTVELLTALAPEVNTTNLLLDRVARGAQRPLFSVQRDGVWHGAKRLRFPHRCQATCNDADQ